MYFDIDADLIYTRPRLTKVDGRSVVIEENITVKPYNKWKRIYLPPDIVISLEDKIEELNDLFDIEKFGQIMAAAAFETYEEIDDSDEPFVKLIIYSEFNALGTREHALSLWNSEEFINSWRDAFESLEDYFEKYCEKRFGLITEEWFEDDCGRLVTDDTDMFKELGFYQDENWYQEGYRFTGFKNINAIQILNVNTGRRNKTSLEKVVKQALNFVQDAAYQQNLSLEDYYKSIDVDSYKNWHDGRIKFFQKRYGNKNSFYSGLILSLEEFGYKIRPFRRKMSGIFDYAGSYIQGVLIGAGLVFLYHLITSLFS